MPAMFTDPIPSQSSSKTKKFRTLTAQFGDGYSESAPNGINYKIDMWNLSFEALDQTQYNTVTTFFDTQGSFSTFTWTAFGDSAAKTWRMTPEGYSVSYKSGNIYNLSLNIEQVY